VSVGGKNSVWGPVLWTFFLFCLPEMIKIAPEAELLVFGTLMLLVATWMPNGVAGGMHAAVRRVYRRPVAIPADPPRSRGAE
jgi:ABC-type branched-subunit amino acid transport system permease subunit